MNLLNDKEIIHYSLMDAITKKIYQNNLPLALKGGTALLFGYNLDRMSLDLDFDANKHINLESVIKESFLSFYGENKLNLININLKKDTDDVKRYIIDYKNLYNNDIFKLKIEMSFRRKFDNDETNIINGKRIFKLPYLFDFKKAAFENRTASRDLHDIIFIGNNYADILNSEQIDFIKNIHKNISNVINRYSEAYKEDTILKDRFEEDIIILEQIATNKFNMTEKELPQHKHENNPFVNQESNKPDAFTQSLQNKPEHKIKFGR